MKSCVKFALQRCANSGMRRLAEKLLSTFHSERKRHLKEPRITTAWAKTLQSKNTSYAMSTMTATFGPKGAGHFASTSASSHSTAPQDSRSARSVPSSGHDLDPMRGVRWVSASAPNASAGDFHEAPADHPPDNHVVSSFFIFPQSEQGLRAT